MRGTQYVNVAPTTMCDLPHHGQLFVFVTSQRQYDTSVVIKTVLTDSRDSLRLKHLLRRDSENA